MRTCSTRCGGRRRRRARPLLDAGCGTGGLLRQLAAQGDGRLQVGIDIMPRAAAMARDKSGSAVAVASADRLPFRDASLGTILSVDVICHRAVEPAPPWPRRGAAWRPAAR